MTAYWKWDRSALGTAIGLFFLLQLITSFRYNLNWDEYFYLSKVYAFVEGRLSEPLQSFHVELLTWLTWVPGVEADQLVAGRLFMMLCEAGSLFCLYRIVRQLVSVENAMFAIVAWGSARYALLHGASFRADPLAGFLMMAALAILMCAKPRWRQSASAGILAAAGLLVTIKSAFFLPAFLGVLAWRWQGHPSEYNRIVRSFALSLGVLLVAAALLWTLHANSLSPAVPLTGAATRNATLAQGSSILDKVILSQTFFPRSSYIIAWASHSYFSLLLCGIGLWSAVRGRSPASKSATILTVSLFAAPLLSLVFYRNAFSYFFPFIMLPVAVAAGLGAEHFKRPLYRSALLAGMVLTMLMHFAQGWTHDQSAQRAIARVAHGLFPRPVAYIDRNGMLPSFPKTGYFMSTWGTERYRAGQTETLAEAIRRDQPPLLILNAPLLQDAVDPQEQPLPLRLHNVDVETLSNNYIRHWGPIWVAGKRLPAGTSNFRVLIAGTYTLECDGRRRIGGTAFACGSTLWLGLGVHAAGGGDMILRWGDHLSVPPYAPPTRPIYFRL